MFELTTIGIGAAGSLVLLVLKLAAIMTASWWIVAIPLLVGIAIAGLKNGLWLGDLLDLLDFLPTSH